MTRGRLEAIGWLAAITLALVVAWIVLPGDRTLALHVYVLLVGVLVVGSLLAAIGASSPRARRSALDEALARRTAPPRAPDDLSRMERVVTISVASAYDFHTRLRPLLQDVAAARLERTGRRPSAETLGRWWELLRPDRPAPAERFAPGIAADDLRDLVADLQRM